jgi:hypothetical protein
MMLGRTGSFLNKILVPGQVRAFSTAAGINTRFEAAYQARTEAASKKGPTTRAPSDVKTYGKGYYTDKLKGMKSGYTHPYHSEANPLIFGHMEYMKLLYEAVGPEQVSPHYESLSKSRRGLIFLFAYIGSIASLSRLGGWSHNEWIRGMIFHHEYILCFYLALIETRHFTFVVGPKFTNWYNAYTNYEIAQMMSNWNDVCEEVQQAHLVTTKQQIGYVDINAEYDMIKKNALSSFMTNQRLGLEAHMKVRARNMLKNISDFEHKNLKNLLGTITSGAFEKVQASVSDPATKEQIEEDFFKSALNGLRAGVMRYEEDPLLPILTNEIQTRSEAFKGLSAEEERDLLQLSDDQRKAIANGDRAEKASFLAAVPAISHGGVKAHEKYKSYVATLGVQH